MGLFKSIDHLFAHGKGIKYWATHPFGDAHNAKEALSNMTNEVTRHNKEQLDLFGGIMTGGISTEAGLVKEVIKGRVSKFGQGVAKRYTKNLVHNKRPTKENTAFYGKNKHRSQIPEGSTLLRESRYSEVYRDPDGKIHVWGKPTIAPNSKNLLLHPYSTGREWGENARRRFDPKYRKSDPVYRDMAKIRKEYGRADHISGYSRGGAYANMQPYSNKTEYTIHGAYTPWNEPDRRIKIRTSWKDPVHKYARYVSTNPYGRMGPKGRRR